MDESEQRRERLKAMRMEASQSATAYNNGDNRSAVSLSNPLLESANDNDNQVQAQSFNYYTDPMAAYSGNKQRSKVSPQSSHDYSLTSQRPQMNEMFSQQPRGQLADPSYAYNTHNRPQGAFSPSPSGNRGPGQGYYPSPRHGPSPHFCNIPGYSSGRGYPSPRPNHGMGSGGYPSLGPNQDGSGPGYPSPGPNHGMGPGGYPSHGPNQHGSGSGQGYTSPGPNHGLGPGRYPSPGPNQDNSGPGQGYPSPGPSHRPGPGGYSSPGPNQGRGNWLGNYMNSGRGGYPSHGRAQWSGRGRGRGGPNNHVTAEDRPDLFFNRSMVEDPWKFLEPVIWKSNKKQWFPHSMNAKKAKVSESAKQSSSKPSLAEILAASFHEAAKDEHNAE